MVFFFIFVLVYEQHTINQAQVRIETHARIIEDSLWSYNQQGSYKYLQLAAFSDHYESLAVRHSNGEIFQQIEGNAISKFKQLLLTLHIIPRRQLYAHVFHGDNIIGQMEAVWIPKTIYTYAYVGIALLMFLVIILLNLRLLKSKTELEERVESRTFELKASNVELKKEIEERVRAEREKKNLQKKLERSKKMESLGLLAGGVAHDLNNVLSGIVSYPDLLLMDLPENSPLRAPIETIKESGQKAATIVQDLLTLARRGVSNSEILNLNDLIKDQQRSPEYGQLFTEHPDIKILFHLDAELPNIEGSPVHLNKTVMNLIYNAAEAQPGGGKIIVRTKNIHKDLPDNTFGMFKAGDYIHLQIKDEGKGISEKDLQHIFEPFYTKKRMGRSGSGLGLAVVWGTVQDHNGIIDVKSQPHQGTTFDLYFPVTHAALTEVNEKINIQAIKGNGETILVVDDMESQRKIAKHQLKRLNYTVQAVESGEAAVAYLEKNTVDLIILDMIMDPGMDGLETWRQIIELHPEQRSIIASGYAETKKVKTAQSLGAGQYLHKPYMFETLAKAVREALNQPLGKAVAAPDPTH
jgi:signal transduction histidine kinase/ActR/RegA family two-component response regulator